MTVRTDGILIHDVDSGRERTTRIIARVTDYLFGLLYTILLVRLVLEFLEARRGSGFYVFIHALTAPFYAPFKGIIASDSAAGAHLVVWPLVVAIVAYMLLHALIRGLLRLIARS